MNRRPSSRCASTTKGLPASASKMIVMPHDQLSALGSSAMIFQYFKMGFPISVQLYFGVAALTTEVNR